ncbi:MAG: bifunctional histidinol-phosphatase/imidazoleglycerol-phosphate dehydratase HisB [Bacteroidota bacterium]
MNIIFLDRDGTIIQEPPDQQVDSFEKLELIPGVIRGLHQLVDRGYELVLVTNQDHLGTAGYPMQSYKQVQNKLTRLMAGEGIRFLQTFVCPHGPEDGCRCRKPATGLVDAFLAARAFDRDRSWMLGDRETDVQFGRAIGVHTVRLGGRGKPETSAEYDAHDFPDACRFIQDRERFVRVRRTTAETDIRIELAVDGSGRHDINTGIGFFDHMLAQLIKHASMDATIFVRGDLRVDEHHTVEDTGLALGDALRQALGDKRGIERYGFTLPMDESVAHTVLDLGGRSYLAFEADFERERVGELPTELVEDFFRAFANGLRANLHITVTGRNDHHKIEAIFKSVARALRVAIGRDERRLSELPSTKGVL